MPERSAVKRLTGTNGSAAGAARPPATVTRPELMPDGTDREFRVFVHRLLAFSARLEAIRSGFGAQVGLSGIQYSTLISIAHLGREIPAGVKEVADHLGLSGSFATLVIGQLTALGLVDKATNADDRRRVMLTVTAKGKALLEDLSPIQRQVNDRLFGPLDAPGFTTLNRIFGALVQSGDDAAGMLQYLPNSGLDAPEAPARRAASRR